MHKATSLLHIFLSYLLYLCWAQNCPERNGRFADPSQCDAYIECEDGIPTPKLCPDGLMFSNEASFFSYPCVYPGQTDCSSRPSTQPAQPTASCPHQFGYYLLGDANNCGQYLNCAHGKGYTFNCPEGLAFNHVSLRCDWADLVPTCNAEGYLGFTCPVTYSNELGYPAEYSYHRAAGSCDKYFICIQDRPRLFGCPEGQAFSEDTKKCEDERDVSGC
uniref:Putative peritrophin n=1 Tax=Triatoma infestans TaxID=30076 RepID=A0A023F905_TRIIF